MDNTPQEPCLSARDTLFADPAAADCARVHHLTARIVAAVRLLEQADQLTAEQRNTAARGVLREALCELAPIRPIITTTKEQRRT